MPIDCSTIQNPEERAHCLLIQNRQAALRAVDMTPIPTATPRCASHLRTALHLVHTADDELTLALEALHHREG